MGRGVKMGGGPPGEVLGHRQLDFTENPKSFFQSEVLLAGSTSSLGFRGAKFLGFMLATEHRKKL